MVSGVKTDRSGQWNLRLEGASFIVTHRDTSETVAGTKSSHQTFIGACSSGQS